MSTPRLPFEPLESVIRGPRIRHVPGCPCSTGFVPGRRLDVCMTDFELAERLGTATKTITTWRQFGVPLWSADRAAVHIGRHPGELWPEFFLIPILPGRLGCDVEGCDRRHFTEGLCWTHHQQLVVSRQCTVAGCDRWRHARSWCVPHYLMWRRTGSPTSSEPARRTA